MSLFLIFTLFKLQAHDVAHFSVAEWQFGPGVWFIELWYMLPMECSAADLPLYWYGKKEKNIT